jgi:peptidoglycan/xylan/chitin deacetylase (PgdA/CDA1 family)
MACKRQVLSVNLDRMRRLLLPVVSLVTTLFMMPRAVSPSDWRPTMEALPAPSVDFHPPHPWIALTFDDGPHPKMTEQLLTLLSQEKVPATFFVVGKMAERYPYLVQEIADGGHELCNHGYNHVRLSRLNHHDLLDELDRTRTAIRRITGHDTCYYRPPGGAYSRSMVQMASRAGYHMVLWSTLTKDVSGATVEQVTERIVQGAKDGGVVLMHSGMPNTLKALPAAIQILRNEGYQFVTVSTLYGASSTH